MGSSRGTRRTTPAADLRRAAQDGADGVLVADLTVPYTVTGSSTSRSPCASNEGASPDRGGRAADLLRDIVEQAGEGADVIAELGIGLNHALTPRGHVMLDERRRHRPCRDRAQHRHLRR
jgi:hypothetical protein